MLNKIFSLQKRAASEILSLMYKAGMIPLMYKSYLFGRYIYINNSYEKDFSFIQNGERLYSSKPVNNVPLGIIGGIILFIILVIIWKLICELLLIILEFFETNIK